MLRPIWLIGVDLIPAFVPYLVLTIVSFAFIALSSVKARSLKLIPFYIAVAGAVYMLELIIFIILHSYDYMPGILKDPFYDSAMGAIVSNGFIVPSACTLIAVYGVRFRRILLIAAGFMGIEQTFISLGIFEHHWWKIIYTGIGLTFLFATGKWFWRKLCQSDQPYLFRLIVLYIINVSLQGTIMSSYLLLFHRIGFRPGWFEDPARDNLAFATLIVHIDSVLFAWLISMRGNWIWKTIVIGSLACGYWWLMRRDILYTSGIGLILLLILLQVIVLQLLNGIYRIVRRER
ncbi:hypothetical protein M3194_24970 [Paenibacillus glycanilyticus]|uniref:hypothetical protein n=1 Tax=Paenibacillus glycanilyticus TaxID=126569 RepID=UPI00203DBF35|nr:hypothetical protein [Paenibacillus glycanilyticus]MCM3630587.1 hypothetical protein [Paenibacillus glycanilyticus]